jgi:hypothetical protein
LRNVLAHIWELEPSWDLRGNTLGQFQKVWLALCTLCSIHGLVCFKTGNEIRTIVVSKNSLGSGQVHRAGIPIINERLLHWVLGVPHHRNVRTLWQVGGEGRYMPKEGKHYTYVSTSPIEFGGIRFLTEGIVVRLQALYHEFEDIDCTGLP